MPISSLPSPYGIGTLGAEARKFADFLAAGGQSCWQLLPVGPTSYGDSPYQSFSSFAGNPYFIDLDILAEWGLLEPEEYQFLNWGNDPGQADYELLYKNRFQVLRLAVSRLSRGDKFEMRGTLWVGRRNCVCVNLPPWRWLGRSWQPKLTSGSGCSISFSVSGGA